MNELILYGLDETGEAVLRQQLGGDARPSLRAIARAQLNDHHAVEIWDGPLCVVRLRREPQTQA